MSKLAKRFLKDGAIYSLQPFIAKAISVFLVPLYTAYLTTDQYGEFSFIFAIGTFLRPIIDMGQVSSFWKFNSDATTEQKSSIVSTTILIRVFIGTAVALLMTLLWVAFGIGGVLFIGYIISYTLYSSYKILQCKMRALHKARLYLISTIAYSFILVGMNLLLVAHFGLNSLGVVMSTTLSFTLFGILALIATAKNTGLHFSTTLARKMIKYGAPLALGNIAGVLLGVTDKFMIKALLGDSALGLYSFGFKFGMMFQGFVVTTFFLAWNPIRWEIYKKSNGKDIFARISNMINFGLPGLALITSGILILAGSFLSQGESFLTGLKIVPIVALGYSFFGLYYFDIMGILFTGKTKYITAIIAFGSVVNIIMNYILISMFGIIGASIATCLSYLIMRTIGHHFSTKMYPVRSKPVLKYFPMILAVPITYYATTNYQSETLIQTVMILLTGGSIILAIGIASVRKDLSLIISMFRRSK